MAGTDLTGIASTYRTPGNYAEIVFAQGPSSAAAGAREVVLVMPKTAAGTWTVNTLYPIKNEADASTGAGPGSPLHRAARKFLKKNKDAKLWGVAYAATSGGTPATATLVLTIATTATGTGTLSVWIAGELCQYTFASGETATTIGDGIELAINSKTWLPVTASNAAGTVTLSAKIAGISQGNGTIGPIRCYEEITSGVGTTAVFTSGNELGDDTAGAEGSTTEATNFAAALAVLDSTRKYYIGTSLSDATNLAALQTHISTKSEPKRGLRSVAVAAFTDTLANGSTIATGRNYERLQMVLAPEFQSDLPEIVGEVLAVRQKYESADFSYNFNATKLDLIGPYAVADRMDADDIEDAIIDGLTPLSTADDGVRLVHSVTTRSKDATGALNDSRASRTVKVSTSDAFVDTLLVRYGLRYGNKKFKDDERLADGSVNPNQKQIAGVVRPSNIVGTITQVVDEFADEHLQEIDAIKESISVLKSEGNPGRAAVGMDLHVIDWLDQITTRVAEVSEG